MDNERMDNKVYVKGKGKGKGKGFYFFCGQGHGQGQGQGFFYIKYFKLMTLGQGQGI